MQAIARLSHFVGNTFAIWVLLFAILAFFAPAQFTWIVPYIVPLLGIIMFGMGLTLSKKDFAEVFKRPGTVLIGVLGQRSEEHTSELQSLMRISYAVFCL